jgi:hypothetical protein
MLPEKGHAADGTGNAARRKGALNMGVRPVRKFITRRTGRAAAVGLLAIGLSAAAIVAVPGRSHPVVVHAASTVSATQDVIQYVQTTGSQGTYFQFIPVSGKATSQAITSGGGGCSIPTPAGSAMLNFAGHVYTGTDAAGNENYTGSPTTASVGAYKQRTGVCGVQSTQDWSVDNVAGSGAEALDFSIGSNALVVGRILSEASIDLQRSDKLTGAVDVQLVESLNGNQVANQCFSLPTSGTPVSVDSSNTTTGLPDAECGNQTTALTTGFDTVELRVLTNGGSVSVVGPSSTFFLANQICSGTPINTTSTQDANYGQVNITVALNQVNGQNVCKSYTNFNATQTVSGGTVSKIAEFDSQQVNGYNFTVTVDWGYFNYCTPSGNDGTTACPVTQVALNDQNYSDQTFCSQATQADQLCTTQKNYTYVPDPANPAVTLTHITEVWSGINDFLLKGG